MLQDRLNGLAMCSIEAEILDNIDLDVVLNDFASQNARRKFFVKNCRRIIIHEVIGVWFLFEVIIIHIIIIIVLRFLSF